MPVSKSKMRKLLERDREMDLLEKDGFDFQAHQLVEELKRRKEEMIELDKQGFKFDEYEPYLPEAETDQELAFWYVVRDTVLQLKSARKQAEDVYLDAVIGSSGVVLDLWEQRRKTGYSIEEIAKKMGVSKASVVKFEDYVSSPTLEFAFKYAWALGKKLTITILDR